MEGQRGAQIGRAGGEEADALYGGMPVVSQEDAITRPTLCQTHLTTPRTHAWAAPESAAAMRASIALARWSRQGVVGREWPVGER